MYIKSYSCNRFAGIKDKEVNFEKGLNVILGPNESGKSTIIDGIHSTLFKSIKLKNNNTIDRNFTNRYMPKSSGDSIDGNIVIVIDGEEYILYKEWGEDEKIQFTTPDGKLIKNEASINDELSKLLMFGEGTYTNIVFAKQRDLKAAINNIVNSSEVTNEINALLRKTMMELDGISLDKLQQQIEDETEELLKRWDMDKNYPENNKGINNPYKVGIGKVLESFYKKENLKLQMDKANNSEMEFEKICNLLKVNEDKIKDLKARKEELEKIEDDVNSRLLIEAELKFIEKDLEILAIVNKEWPKSNLLLEQFLEKIEDVNSRREKFNDEKKNYRRAAEKKDLELRLKNIEEISKKIESVNSDIGSISSIKKADIDELTKIEKEILTVETAMSAGVMIGNLTNFNLSGDIWITKDLDKKEILRKNIEFRANGFIKIEYEDKFQLEIKTGELDFEELKDQYDVLKSDHEVLLKDLKIESLEEGKLNKEKIDKLIGEEKVLSNKMAMFLGETTLEELIDKVDDLDDVKNSRDIIDIELDLENLNKDEMEFGINKKTLENKIKEWNDKYIDEDNLLNFMVDKKGELNKKKNTLQNLAPLPIEFLDGEDFKNALNKVKFNYEEYQEEQMGLKSKYYEVQKGLLDISYEELKILYEDAEIEFKKNIDRSKNLLKIKDIFIKTKEDLCSNPMESLVREFTRVLSVITNGNYHLGEIDENFELRLESKTRGIMPIDILSAGTYDAVTLSLRFSILKHIYGDREGYVVLDDCLVDLDPERKALSVKLIIDFAENNQVIFTTCDPLTAELLGGNTIKI